MREGACMLTAERPEWRESRNGELFFILAEKTDGKWRIYERSTWEVAWHPCSATPERVAKAESGLVGKAVDGPPRLEEVALNPT